MKFVSVRELRNKASSVWNRLKQDEVVLTSNGKPVALMTRVGEEDVEELLKELRLARSRILVRRLQQQAKEAGTAELSADEIDSLVQQTRSELLAK